MAQVTNKAPRNNAVSCAAGLGKSVGGDVATPCGIFQKNLAKYSVLAIDVGNFTAQFSGASGFVFFGVHGYRQAYIYSQKHSFANR